jgi:hypothetical protein
VFLWRSLRPERARSGIGTRTAAAALRSAASLAGAGAGPAAFSFPFLLFFGATTFQPRSTTFDARGSGIYGESTGLDVLAIASSRAAVTVKASHAKEIKSC